MLARDIIAAQAKRQNKRYESFEQILNRCHKTINKSIEVLRNNHHCFFEVPEFIIGYPLYDLNECIEYVIRKLTQEGFYVRYFFPRILYISWAPQPSPALPQPQPQIAKKAKRTKVVQTKKSTGKFILNLS